MIASFCMGDLMLKKEKSVDDLKDMYTKLIADTESVKVECENKLAELQALEKEYRKLINDLVNNYRK